MDIHMTNTRWRGSVLSLYATSRGFAFTLFEGPLSPVDWGVKVVRRPNKNRLCIESMAALIGRHQPDALVLEDCRAPGSRRSPRIRRLYRAIEVFAATQAIETYSYSRHLIRETFAKLGAMSKDEIAAVIARYIPEFEQHLPPVRRVWMSEDRRMGIFDAAALAFAFFHLGVERA